MENSKPLISVIVPAYNEQQRIAPTLQSIDTYFQQHDFDYEILVVDDGSHDKTHYTVVALGLNSVRVIDYGRNRGKGYAVHFGALAAKGDWILFTDADNSTPISELDKLWPFHNDYQVVIGSRYVKGSTITQKQATPRIILSRLGNALIQLLILPGIKDTQCGFKLFSHACAQTIFSRQTIWHWGFDMEILRIAKEHGYKIKEVGVVWKNDEQSKIQSGRVFTRTLSELLTIKWNSLQGKYLKS